MVKKYFLFSPDEGAGAPGEGGEGQEGEGQPETGDSGREANESVPRSDFERVQREAAKRRREVNDLKTQLEQEKSKNQSALDQVNQRLTTLETDLSSERTTNRDLRAQQIAERVGIFGRAREDAVKLLPWEDIEDQNDEAAIEAAFREMVKDRSYLLGGVPGGADGGARGGTGEGQDMNALIRQASGR